MHLRSWNWAYRGLLPDGYLSGLDHHALAQRWRRRLCIDYAEESALVIENAARQVAGFVTFGPLRDDPSWLGYAGEIYMLYLEPDLVGRGWGASLMRRATEELARGRCHWLVVWVLARNDLARDFYEREGFQLDGARRWDPFGSRSVPVVRLAKALNPVVDFERVRATRPSRAP